MKLGAPLFERVQAAARAVAEQLDVDDADGRRRARLGPGRRGRSAADARRVAYASLPGFPETTVAGHPGRLVAGRSRATSGDKTVLLLCGRVHGYEGYPPSEVGFGVRVVAALGVRTLIVTNASGAVDPAFVAGRDRRHLRPHQPDLRLAAHRTQRRAAGAALRRHDRRLRSGAARAGHGGRPAALGAPLREAIYAGMAGPAYETPAEVRLLRTLGAGLVGMSTVHEVIAARHAGLAVLGLSLVANLGRRRQPRAAAPRGRHPRGRRRRRRARAPHRGRGRGPGERREHRRAERTGARSRRRAPSAGAPTPPTRSSRSARRSSTSAGGSPSAATSRTPPMGSPSAPSATRSRRRWRPAPAASAPSPSRRGARPPPPPAAPAAR